MKKLKLTLGLALSLFSTLAWADAKDFYMRRALERSHHLNTDLRLEFFLADTLQQKIDHFNPQDGRTFTQRYYITPAPAANGAPAPVLLYICGEATCSGDAGSMVKSWAQELGASVALLEHRYYGRSQPFPTLSAENMKFLTIENAMEDLVFFQKEMMKDPRFQGPWIVIGGSYAGTLSAYYRLKHPEMVVGALASSAPVRAKIDFEEYDLSVSKTIPATCATRLRAATTEIEKRLNDPSTHDAVKTLFGAADVKDDVDFLAVVADMAAIAVQYGSSQTICDGVNQADRIAGYAQAGKSLMAMMGITPVQDSTQGAISEDPASYLAGFGLRPWLYQTCTEFGWFQVAYHDPQVSVRSSRINVDFMNQVCQKLFHTPPVNVDPVNSTYYQALLQKNSVGHIIFTNGSTDPWSTLSISKELANNSNPDNDTVTVAGGSHCSDLGYSFDGAADAAHDLTIQRFKSWVQK